MKQRMQEMAKMSDAAAIVEVYKPDAKPNAPPQMEYRAPAQQQRQQGKENYYMAKPEQRSVTNEPVYMEMEKLTKPKKSDYDENIFALASKKPSV